MMKKIRLLLTLLLLCNIVLGKENCSALHIGKFSLKGKVEYIIERTETTQIEKCPALGYEVSYDLIWVDDCSYELRNRKLLSGKDPIRYKVAPDDVIKGEIITVNNNHHIVRVTSNFANYANEYEMVRVD